MKKTLLAVNFNHDGSGVILRDGRIRGYVNTERFSRKKKHPGIRQVDLDNLLAQAGIGLGAIDHVLLCNLNNMDSFEIGHAHGSDLKETWFEFWVDQRGDRVRIADREFDCTLNPAHHLLHCALAYYTSPFDSAVSFSADPVGCAAYLGSGRELRRLRINANFFLSSKGYAAVSGRLFKSSLFGAGKVMGLAPFGRGPSANTGRYAELANGHRLRHQDEFVALMDADGDDAVFYEADGASHNATMAYNMQRCFEEQLTDVLEQLFEASRAHGVEPNICLGGGSALNSCANQIAFEASPFEGLHLHPACGDDGTAIGATLWFWHEVLGNERRRFSNREMMYSRRCYDATLAETLASSPYRDRVQVEQTTDYVRRAARALADGRVIGWFQQASEVGPRALGHRSILADPRRADMQDKVNERVKFREKFRPFAPAVLNEHAKEWFGLEDSPFMLRVCPVLKPGIPAVTHIDNTARIQTVTREDNDDYYDLIAEFHALTGVPVVLNTSFNTSSEPIVETPDDALRCFVESGLELLVFKDHVVSKRDPE